MVRPLLLLDVDGPLNPYAAPWFRERRPEGGYEMRYLTLGSGRSYWVALNRWHGERLSELAEVCDLAWASTWQEDANRLIAPRTRPARATFRWCPWPCRPPPARVGLEDRPGQVLDRVTAVRLARRRDHRRHP